MEQAEDSEGFDSCEEGSEATNINPFQDFNKQIQEVEDENVKCKYFNLNYGLKHDFYF